jgi:hypothetical protein
MSLTCPSFASVSSDPSFKYIYPNKVTLNDAKDSVIDAKINTPMLVEMAHKLRD